MQQSVGTPVTDRRRRRRRWPIVALAVVVVVLAGVFYLGGGWYFSGRLYQQGLSGAAKRAARPTYDLSVTAVTSGTVTLRVPTNPDQLLTPGVWGLQWPTGYGQVTTILARGQRTVTRAFQHLAGSPLAAGPGWRWTTRPSRRIRTWALASDSTTSPTRGRWGPTRRG